jgi:hypothetical protein
MMRTDPIFTGHITRSRAPATERNKALQCNHVGLQPPLSLSTHQGFGAVASSDAEI